MTHHIMRIDLKAVGSAFVTFLFIWLPVYFRFHLNGTAESILSNLMFWLPYLAAFFSGLSLAYCSQNDRSVNLFVLAMLISLSFGLANYFLPSDFPGFYSSLWVMALSFPAVLFLVAAGIGAKNLIKAISDEYFP